VGTQYRSAIFYHSPEQKTTAEQLIVELEASRVWDRPIITKVTPFERFYPAEIHHQEYFKRNPDQAYCRIVIAPKVAKFRKRYLDELKKAQ
jgi:peptide-methionine (S)-S-oxide reductase